MTTTVLEKTSEQIADSAQKVADVLQDRIHTAKRLARQGGEKAEELYRNTTRQIQRRPAEAVGATFLFAFGAGVLVGWLMRRK